MKIYFEIFDTTRPFGDWTANYFGETNSGYDISGELTAFSSRLGTPIEFLRLSIWSKCEYFKRYNMYRRACISNDILMGRANNE